MSENNLPPVEYIPNFLETTLADKLYKHCQQLAWEQNNIRLMGKTIPVPRLECMYGDEGCNYVYSKSVLLEPLRWTSPLSEVRSRIESQTGYQFNIVLCNRYRTGLDSVGWHNDNEPSMGETPAIAEISLGQERKFQMRPHSGESITDFWLEHGSLLLMKPGCQENWVHQLPKTSRALKERINLTFRPHINGTSS
ncbi:alpha-ketoglutarate-dependent dioxygenase AlkB [Plectonema radiosum NIES-515]|uniref:Alpha-ketoglutarate-dependent dioxygenase AlkB n=1 Tax=Plectonema radiosum NIES-515 TaxID=2986073 RepID=A0ABT3AYT9_9CYAN|nr:alpha-ketoglutarate-dependent dioxygenase AlkB [Plectonema radiosum]MCV3214304.1 alpha-ketoglutarate-dependent dioxygenase AlkB [Plectonema radiosum NIES-515]